MNNVDGRNGLAACWMFLAGLAAMVSGAAAGLSKLAHLGVLAMMGSGCSSFGSPSGCFSFALLMGLGMVLVTVVSLPLGLVSVIGLVLSIPVLVAGILWLVGAGVARAVGSRRGVREEGGVRMKYLHWSGGWRDGWRGVPRKGMAIVAPIGFWHLIGELWRDNAVSSAGQEESLAQLGERALAPIYFVLRTPVVAVLWGPRTAAAIVLRACVRVRRGLRECRECHGWTTSPGWRCPHCGIAHSRLGPSAKFGILEWLCSCGGRMPTLAVAGRRALEAVCPDCGGALDPVERGRADVAFLGSEESGKTLLKKEAMAKLAATEGRRPMRLYDVEGKTVLDAASMVRQRHWEHIGALVFAVDCRYLGASERVLESWFRIMDREHPERVRRMACAVVMTNTDDEPGFSQRAGERECRAFLECAGGGNLLNGLDGRFRRVKAFAAGGAGKDSWWTWTAKQAFGRMPAPGKGAT